MAIVLKPNCVQILCLMIFWGQIQNYIMRYEIDVAIAALVQSSSQNDEPNQSNDVHLLETSKQNISYNIEEEKDGKEDQFDLSPILQSHRLGAFNYGYVVTQIIGGRLAEMYGTKKIYGGGLLLTCIVSFLLPSAAKLNVYLFIALNVLQGVFSGVTLPALHAMTARWIPPLQQGSFMSRSYLGMVIGILITDPFCNAIIKTFGWESCFYVVGSITLVWFIFWCLLVYDNPNSHPRISENEKKMINTAVSETVDTTRTFPVPWRSIFTSVPFYGLLFSEIGLAWGLSTLIRHTPLYMESVQDVKLETDGLMSKLPFGFMWLGAVFLSCIAEFILRKKYISKTNVRRLFNVLAMIGPAIALCMVAFAPDTLQGDTNFVIAVLCGGLFLNGAFVCSLMNSYIDLAPNYAGTLLGVGNTVAFIIHSVVPVINEQVLANGSLSQTRQWQIIFMVPSALYILSNITYLITVTSDVQTWNSKKRNYMISMNSLGCHTPKLNNRNQSIK